LGDGEGGFEEGVHFAAGPEPTSVAVGDLNNDGFADLGVADKHDSKIRIYINNTNGAFPLLTTLSNVGSQPHAIRTARLNDDNHLDLITVNRASNNISVIYGNGDGTFAAPSFISVGARPVGLDIADLNGDNRLDFAVANSESDNLSVIFGGGKENRSSAQYTVGDFPADIKIFDVNHDTFPDLLTVNQNTATPGISILFGKGGGSFGEARNFQAGKFPNDLAVGDFDDDGHIDVAVTDRTYSSVVLLRGNSEGTFHPPINYGVGLAPSGLIAEDFNEDGRVDLATANFGSGTVSVLINGCQNSQKSK
jgi:hypothetical protein